MLGSDHARAASTSLTRYGTTMNPILDNNQGSPVWTQIEALVDGVRGWTPVDEPFSLYTLTWMTVDLSGERDGYQTYDGGCGATASR